MSNLPVINEDALDLLYLWARKEQAKQDAGLPSEWDQGVWVNTTSCGTACCIAGKAVAVAGGAYEFERTDDEDYIETNGTDLVMTGFAIMPNGRSTYIDEGAREFLGLNIEESRMLFEGDNSLEDIREVIRDIKAGEYR